MGAIRQKPWAVDGDRVIDGDDGVSRFVADTASILEELALLLD